MRTTRIFCAQPLQSDGEFPLEDGPSRHIARVLRMQVGDALVVFDGRGGEYAATISAIDRARVSVRTGIHRDSAADPALRIHLGIGVSRGERMDWAVQKATELGVGIISPLLTERTGVKLDAGRTDKKREHWQQIGISACEQSGRCVPPEIRPLGRLDDWLQQVTEDCRLVLEPGAPAAALPAHVVRGIALLVGPEGGLDARELAAAAAAGFSALRLGPRVLRTETAPLAALAILQGRYGDMQL